MRLMRKLDYNAIHFQLIFRRLTVVLIKRVMVVRLWCERLIVLDYGKCSLYSQL
jgi:hypothetical protein